jgi:hypothetical protein
VFHLENLQYLWVSPVAYANSILLHSLGSCSFLV